MSKYALAVGINDYPGTGSDLPDCVLDSERWEAALTNRGFTVTRLNDSSATKAAMVEGIQSLVSSLKYGDIGAFVYSGHGTWIADESGDEVDQKDECLVPHDIFTVGPLVDDEIAELFAQRERGARLLFVADSCFSGTVSRFAAVNTSARRVRFMPPEVFLKGTELTAAKAIAPATPRARMLRASDAILMSGAQDWEYSFSTGVGGAFSLAAIAALEEIHAPATYADWMRKIRTKLPNAEYPQNPNLVAVNYQKKWVALEAGR